MQNVINEVELILLLEDWCGDSAYCSLCVCAALWWFTEKNEGILSKLVSKIQRTTANKNYREKLGQYTNLKKLKIFSFRNFNEYICEVFRIIKRKDVEK